MDLVGRLVERAAVEELLDGARAGRSGALVVRGEAGVGKTALLEHARDVASSSGFRVASSVGVESESQFAFGGLHQLCAPLLDRSDVLPDPQRAALDVAFGQQSGPAPDRFLIGLAVLNLLAEVAEDGPLLCLVDDAQWLDEGTAQVLAFVARRIAAERVAILVLLRDPSDTGGAGSFSGLPELRLAGLGPQEARDAAGRRGPYAARRAGAGADHRRGARQPPGAAGAPPERVPGTPGRRVRTPGRHERAAQDRGHVQAPVRRPARRDPAAAAGRSSGAHR